MHLHLSAIVHSNILKVSVLVVKWDVELERAPAVRVAMMGGRIQ
jgi:hypothetical protein